MKTSRFGRFGGTFAPEILMAPLEELGRAWLSAMEDKSFLRELQALLSEFAGRPTPLTHAKNLSASLGCEIWLKREDLLHTGAHKINNALGQVLLARHMGKTRVLAETGAGQHGVATATACAKLGLRCEVYMGEIDAQRQGPNVERMKLMGAQVHLVKSGERTLKDAVNEAMRGWAQDPQAFYVLGSALGPHPYPAMVAYFHEVIGQEARAQILTQHGALPDYAVACVGGGSNAIGLFRAFLDDPVKLIGVEAGGRKGAAGPHAARFLSGSPGILHGCFTWLLQDEHGQVQETHSISAGLDYPAIGPEHAHLHEQGRAHYHYAQDDHALQAFDLLCAKEGILPALESSHALGWVIQEQDSLRGSSVLLNLSGRGDKDLDNVRAYRANLQSEKEPQQ